MRVIVGHDSIPSAPKPARKLFTSKKGHIRLLIGGMRAARHGGSIQSTTLELSGFYTKENYHRVFVIRMYYQKNAVEIFSKIFMGYLCRVSIQTRYMARLTQLRF